MIELGNELRADLSLARAAAAAAGSVDVEASYDVWPVQPIRQPLSPERRPLRTARARLQSEESYSLDLSESDRRLYELVKGSRTPPAPASSRATPAAAEYASSPARSRRARLEGSMAALRQENEQMAKQLQLLSSKSRGTTPSGSRRQLVLQGTAAEPVERPERAVSMSQRGTSSQTSVIARSRRQAEAVRERAEARREVLRAQGSPLQPQRGPFHGR